MRLLLLLLLEILLTCTKTSHAFVGGRTAFVRQQRTITLWSSSSSWKQVAPDLESIPIPFVDPASNSFIECYADSVATVNGVEYTIGVPCDYAVALTYIDDDDQQLVPVELTDPLMDDIFPVAEAIVAEEFEEELVLQRTPQTLTLVGELEDDDEEEFAEDNDLSVEDGEEEDEEVEVLLSFEHRGKEYNLVRLLDPLLLVGKRDDGGENRLLLSKDESAEVMPVLEEMFLETNDGDAMLT